MYKPLVSAVVNTETMQEAPSKCSLDGADGMYYRLSTFVGVCSDLAHTILVLSCYLGLYSCVGIAEACQR